jgi:hypothetical protein
MSQNESQIKTVGPLIAGEKDMLEASRKDFVQVEDQLISQ